LPLSPLFSYCFPACTTKFLKLRGPLPWYPPPLYTSPGESKPFLFLDRADTFSRVRTPPPFFFFCWSGTPSRRLKKSMVFCYDELGDVFFLSFFVLFPSPRNDHNFFLHGSIFDHATRCLLSTSAPAGRFSFHPDLCQRWALRKWLLTSRTSLFSSASVAMLFIDREPLSPPSLDIVPPFPHGRKDPRGPDFQIPPKKSPLPIPRTFRIPPIFRFGIFSIHTPKTLLLSPATENSKPLRLTVPLDSSRFLNSFSPSTFPSL